MSFRNRLQLLWAIALLAPAVAILALLLDRASAPSASEGRAAQGLRTALARYDQARDEAGRELTTIASDPALRAALVRGPSLEFEQRAEEIVRANPRVVGLAFHTADGERLFQAGAPDSVAYAGLAPTVADRGRIGTLVASTRTGPQLVGHIHELTGLEVRLLRGGEPLASTLGYLGNALPDASGEVEVAGHDYQGAYGTAPEPIGRDVRVGVLASEGPVGAGGPSPLLLTFVILLLAVMAIAALSAYVLLARRLDEFVAAARRLRRGEYRTRVEVHGNDRVAALAGELNALCEELADKVEQVEHGRDELEDVTRRVGDAFASGLDPDAVVDIAVRTAVEACGAEAGRALPVDPDKMRSVRVGASGEAPFADALTTAERQVFRARPEEGRELRRRVDGDRRRTTTAHAEAQEAELDGVHALAAPLRARVSLGSASEYLGVISIGRRGRNFIRSERDLFAYLAAQAAVSLENAYMHERMRRQAVTDELTGLDNSRRFHEALAAEIERTRRFRGKAALAMMDIDDFKRVNDEFGHQQGDVVLAEVARELREQCREIDYVARYGGEEMALILPETDLAGAAHLGERVRRAVARRAIGRLDSEEVIGVTASFGVAAVPESAADAEGLIAAADGALYRAKRAGKNRVVTAEPYTGAPIGWSRQRRARRRANV